MCLACTRIATLYIQQICNTQKFQNSPETWNHSTRRRRGEGKKLEKDFKLDKHKHHGMGMKSTLWE